MEYIGPIYLSIYSIEFTVLPIDVFKLEAPIISVVAEQEYQQIYKKYINSIMDVDIKERL